MGVPHAARLLLVAGVASVLLASTASAFLEKPFTAGNDGRTTYTGRGRADNTLLFGNQILVEQMTYQMTQAMAMLKNGTRIQMAPPGEKDTPIRDVEVSCLNSVAPPPLNWRMWCPGKDARVQEYIDKSGATHRIITIRPQPGMTSTMALWFTSWYTMGLGSPVVEFMGKNYYFYHLWHPVDHVQARSTMDVTTHPSYRGLKVGLYTLINERYRNPIEWPYKRSFETNGWFLVEDPMGNMLKSRMVLDMNVMGINLWTMIIDFIDTKEGLVVKAEIIIGVPPKGFDTKDPTAGNIFAATLNDLVTNPMLQQQSEVDMDGAIAAITRHTIEEFSNLQFFVPYLYRRNTITGMIGMNLIPTIGTFMNHLNLTRIDVPTINFYKAIVKMVSAMPPLPDTSFTPGGQKIMATAEAAARFVNGPAGAMHAAGTPELLKQAPLYKGESTIIDRLDPVKAKAARIYLQAIALKVPAGVDPAKFAAAFKPKTLEAPLKPILPVEEAVEEAVKKAVEEPQAKPLTLSDFAGLTVEDLEGLSTTELTALAELLG